MNRLLLRSQVTLFLGVFSIMALSNAIVPVLTTFSPASSWEGAIYAAYFLGAFISTLPSGILTDRYGRTLMMRFGLVLTVTSGIILFTSVDPVTALAARFLEGIGAGLFVPPALAGINREVEHAKMSGYFMALMNAGLVLGLLLAGVLAAWLDQPVAGILLFTVLAGIPTAASLIAREPEIPGADHLDAGAFFPMVKEYRWIWYSSIVLIGITGVVTSLYPKYSGAEPDILGYWIAGMSVATIVAVLLISRFSVDDIRLIRISAIAMAAGVMITLVHPAGFLVIGFLAGLVMIAQLGFLSRIRDHQGIAMGLFSTTSYLGMAVLPFLAGLVADGPGFFTAFCVSALAAVTVAVGVRK